MPRPSASTVAGAATAILVAALGAGAVAIVRALPADGLEAAGLSWSIPVLGGILAALAGAATLAWIVATLATGAGSAVTSAAAAGSLAGAGIVLLVGSGSAALPLTGAATFMLGGELMERAGRPVLVRQRSRLAALGIGLLVAELLAAAGAFGITVPATRLGDPVLLGGAGVALVVLLLRVTRPSAGEAVAFVVGLGTLAVARDASAETAIGIAWVAVGAVLLALGALARREDRIGDRSDDERLPELAARLADAVLRFDGRLRLADWNATAATLLGLDDASTGARIEDLLGIPIAALPGHDAIVSAQRGIGGLDISLHRSGGGLTAIIRDPARAPETERLGRELRGTAEELLQARRTIELQRVEIDRGIRTDPVTGLPSRAATLERLRTEVAEASRYHHPIAVVLLDLDAFTALNRAHGTAAGDAVLREVALRMRLRVRTADALGRLAGDAFLAILPHTDDGGAATFADALRRRLAARPFPAGPTQVALTFSAGVATMRAGEELDADGLLARVEEALASAREAGGDRIALDRLHGLARLEPPDRAAPPEADEGRPS